MKKRKLYNLLKAMAASDTPDVFEAVRTAKVTGLPYEECTVDAPNEEAKVGGGTAPCPRGRFAFRMVAVALSAILLVAGAVYTPSFLSGGTTSGSHAFEIVAYAAVGKGKAITLKNNVNVGLSSMYTVIDNNGNVGIGQGCSFSFKGENLKSVNFTAQNGEILYYVISKFSNALRSETFKDGSARLKKSVVSSFTIPKSLIPDSRVYEGTFVDTREFVKLWNAGKLKAYGNGFKEKLNLNSEPPYDLEISNGWDPTNLSEKVPNNVYVVTIARRSNDSYTQIWRLKDIEGVSGSSVTADAAFPLPVNDYDHVKENNLSWSNTNIYTASNIYAIEKAAYAHAKSGVGSPVVDVIAVKAKFKDGATVTKHIKIFFDSKLTPRMELTD